ncbi:MAG: acyl-CoA thioesterase, partial [Oscillospiraceae bacterium]|nr:acyl-CoA thioesterase [Oscillospiraceae bacterium]
WYEVARTDYIKNVGMSYSEMEKRGIMLPVTGISCRYKSPAKYDETLVITAKIARFTPARIEFLYTVTRKGEDEVLSEGTSSHAFVDATSFKPINFKKAMPDFYERMMKEYEADSST